MPKTLANNINLHYLQTGSGPEVVLIHGNGGNLAVWHLHLVGQLKDEFHFTTYDLRGHGRSEMPPTGYTSLEMAQDLKGLLDALDLAKVSIVGHSWGGDIAMHFSLLYPDRVDRMVLVEPNVADLIELRMKEGWEGWKYWAMRLKEFGIEVPRDKWNDADYMLRQSVNIPIQFGPFKGQVRKSQWLIRLLDTTTLATDYQKVAGMTLDKIRGITHPTLALYGQDSHFNVTYEFFRDEVPACEVKLLDKSTHYGPLEQPELLVDELRRFLGSRSAVEPEA